MAEYLQQGGNVRDGRKWLDNNLRPYLKHVIAIFTSGFYPHLLEKKRNAVGADGWEGRFEIFTMDVTLDENLRPWLTEIQSPGSKMEPDLPTESTNKSDQLQESDNWSTMIREMVEIAVEVDARRRMALPLSVSDLKSIKNWQPVQLKINS